LDTNGYVVVSEEFNDTGRFFGDVAPDAMVALKKVGAYRQMVVYDYQSMCITQVRVNSGAAELILTVSLQNMLKIQVYETYYLISAFEVDSGPCWLPGEPIFADCCE